MAQPSPVGSGARPATGFTYLGLLLAIAVLGVGLLAASEVWVTTARRQHQAQLEWVGRQFQTAIGSYYNATPGVAKQYPQRLEDLLEDRRYPMVRRHLRQIYANPLSGVADWELIKGSSGAIQGVRVPSASASYLSPSLHAFVYQPLNP